MSKRITTRQQQRKPPLSFCYFPFLDQLHNIADIPKRFWPWGPLGKGIRSHNRGLGGAYHGLGMGVLGLGRSSCRRPGSFLACRVQRLVHKVWQSVWDNSKRIQRYPAPPVLAPVGMGMGRGLRNPILAGIVPSGQTVTVPIGHGLSS